MKSLYPLMTHVRDIMVYFYQTKTVYEIPITFEKIGSNFKVYIKDKKIIIEVI